MTTVTPENSYALFRRAEFMLESKRPADAADLLAAVVEHEPDNVAAQELYARALFHSAQLGRAEQAFRHLVEQRPDDGWARIALARVLERRGNADEAAAHRRIAQALGQSE